MLNFEDQISEVEGWLTKREGLFLYELAKRVQPPKVIVEIGSWKGKSTICLAKGSEAGYKTTIYAIDPHTGSSEHRRIFGKVDTFNEFKRNIAKAEVKQFIQPIRDASQNAAKKFQLPIGLLFIDGAHEVELVELDFRLWFPKVVNGGSIAFHDSWHLIGPTIVSGRALLTSREIRNPTVVDSITSFEKVGRNGPSDRLKNLAFLSYRLPLGLIGLIGSNIKMNI